jgi:hypothetical protein
MAPGMADSQTLRLWQMLSILGAFLASVGWVRWFHWAQLVGWFH